MLNLTKLDVASLATTASWPADLAGVDAAPALEVPATIDLATFLDTDALHRVDDIDCVLPDGALPHPPLDAIPPPPPPPPPPAPASLNLFSDFGPISPAPTPPRTTQDRVRHAYDACSPALAPVEPHAHLHPANPSQVLAKIDGISACASHTPENSCCAHAVRENGQLRREKQIMLTKIQSAYRGDPAGYTLWVQESGIQLDPVMSPLPDMPLPPPPPAANPIRGANVMLPCRLTIPTPTDDSLFPPSSSSAPVSPRSPSCNPHLIFGSYAAATAPRLRSVEPMDVDSDSDSDSDDDSDVFSPGMWRRRVHERPPPPCPRLNGNSSMSPCPLEAPARRGMRLEEPRLIVRIPRWKLLGRPPPPARALSPASSILSLAPPSSPVRASVPVGRATTPAPGIAAVRASDLAPAPPDPCNARDQTPTPTVSSAALEWTPTPLTTSEGSPIATRFTLDPTPTQPAPSSAPDPMSASTSSPALSIVSAPAAATSPPYSPARGTDSASPAPTPTPAPTRAPSPTPSTASTPSRAPSPALALSIPAIFTSSPAPAPIPAPAAPTQLSDPPPASATPTPAPALASALTLRDLLLRPTIIPAGAVPLPHPTAPAPPPSLAPLPPRAPGAPVVRRAAHVQVVIATPSPLARFDGVRPATAPPVAGKKPVARAGPSSPPPPPVLRAPSASTTPRGRRASSSAAGTGSGGAAPAGGKATPRGRRSNAAVADVVSPPVTPRVRRTNLTVVEVGTPVTPPRARRTSTTSTTKLGPPETPRACRASNAPTLAPPVPPTTPRTRHASNLPMSTPATALPATPRTRRASKTAAAAAVERPRPPQLPPLDHAPESETEQDLELNLKEPVRIRGRFVEISIPIRVWRKMPMVQPAEVDEASDTADTDSDSRRPEDVDMDEEETAPELPARPARSRPRQPRPPPPRLRRGWRVRDASDDEEDGVIDVEGGVDHGLVLSPSLVAELPTSHGASHAASVELDLDEESVPVTPARPRKRKLELVTSEGLNMVAAKRLRDEVKVV